MRNKQEHVANLIILSEIATNKKLSVNIRFFAGWLRSFGNNVYMSNSDIIKRYEEEMGVSLNKRTLQMYLQTLKEVGVLSFKCVNQTRRTLSFETATTATVATVQDDDTSTDTTSTGGEKNFTGGEKNFTGGEKNFTGGEKNFTQSIKDYPNLLNKKYIQQVKQVVVVHDDDDFCQKLKTDISSVISKIGETEAEHYFLQYLNFLGRHPDAAKKTNFLSFALKAYKTDNNVNFVPITQKDIQGKKANAGGIEIEKHDYGNVSDFFTPLPGDVSARDFSCEKSCD